MKINNDYEPDYASCWAKIGLSCVVYYKLKILNYMKVMMIKIKSVSQP